MEQFLASGIEMDEKIFISKNKEIGLKCKNWAKKNLPNGFVITDKIENCDICISVLYDKILNKDFISTKKCYNFHPAILPNYAGVCGASWAILNNEKHHGATLHLMAEQVDTGDIIEIQKIPISPHDTAFSLNNKNMDVVFNLFKKTFKNILNGKYPLTPQDLSLRKLYTHKDFKNLLNLTRYMRSVYFPNKDGPYYFSRDKKVKIDINYDEL
jgi:methionyl-tRNA formyltransferase